jgi:GntR family transcriptional regulator
LKKVGIAGRLDHAPEENDSQATRPRVWPILAKDLQVDCSPLTELHPTCTIFIEQGGKRVVFPIDPKDPMPIYAQLDRAIRLAIATGQVEVGDRLPTVRELAVDLRINANTVAKVYGELEREGVLETRRGVGTFVAILLDHATSHAQRLKHLTALGDRFLAEAGSLGFTARQAVASLKRRLHEGKDSHGQVAEKT